MARPAAADALAAQILDLLILEDNPDLNLVLRRILQTARRLVGARYAALGVPDGRGGFARFLTAGISEKRAALIGELPRTHGVLGALLDSGPIVLDDIRRHPRFSYYPRHHPLMTDFCGVPITHHGRVLGNLFLSGSRGGHFTARDRRTLATLAGYAGVAIANADLYAGAQELAVVEERTRVARELHDAASQRLFSLVYAARAAALRTEDPASADALRSLEQGASEALHELRSLVYALRPKSLERDGLVATLADHLEALRRTHAVDLRIDADGALDLTLDEEHALLRIAQEAVQNAVKHARGAATRVAIRRDPRAVVLHIEDAGPGFDVDALPHTVRTLGMQTMRQRAEEIGASLDVASEPGAGTSVVVRLPRRPARRG